MKRQDSRSSNTQRRKRILKFTLWTSIALLFIATMAFVYIRHVNSEPPANNLTLSAASSRKEKRAESASIAKFESSLSAKDRSDAQSSSIFRARSSISKARESLAREKAANKKMTASLKRAQAKTAKDASSVAKVAKQNATNAEKASSESAKASSNSQSKASSNSSSSSSSQSKSSAAKASSQD